MTTPAGASLAIACADELAQASAILGAERSTVGVLRPEEPTRASYRDALTLADSTARELRLVADGQLSASTFGARQHGTRLLAAERILSARERSLQGIIDDRLIVVIERHRAARLRWRLIGRILADLADEKLLAGPKERFGLA
jgi:hypothetical protein